MDEKSLNLSILANFVHQAVNPLNSIAGTLNNIANGTYEQGTVPKKANSARAQIEQVIALLRNLTYFSELSSDSQLLKAPGNTGVSILPQVIIEALQFYLPKADFFNIEIELTDRKSQYKIAGRPEILKQVFMNLIDNAIKYGNESSKITITPFKNTKEELIVEVKGSSVPFSTQEASSIFDFQSRGESAQEIVAIGSGIGLYICKETLKKYFNADISASYDHKHGEATFRIKFNKSEWSI